MTTSLRTRLPLPLAALLAFLLPLLLYLPALRFEFVTIDDPSFIAANPLVAGGLRPAAVRDAFLSPVPTAPMYIPLLWVSYMLDVSLFGAHPWAFHLSNILLHSFSSLLLFFFLLRLARRHSPGSAPVARRLPPVVPCLLLSLLWSLHPLRVESVAWAAERKDCLAAFFCLLTLHAWLSALAAPRSLPRLCRAAAAFSFFALGLLSKPSLVPLPVFLALLALLPGRPRRTLRSLALGLLPFCLAAALASWATSAFHARHAALPPPSLLSRLATIPSVLLFYLAKTVFPRNLSVLYPQWTSPLWLGALLSVPLLAAAVWLFRRRRVAPLPFLGAAFAALFVLPVSGIVPVAYNLVADRYTLLPAIGLSVALLPLFLPCGNSVPPTPSPASRPRCGVPHAACGIAIVFFAAATALHLPVWRDTASLFVPARRLLPDHFTICGFDANVATQYGEFAASRAIVARAARVFPDARLLLDDVPNVLALDGPQAALDYLFSHLPPDSALAPWSFLAASLQLDLGRPADALATASAALASSPPGDAFRNRLLQLSAVAAHRLGDSAAALDFARRSGLLPPGAAALGLGHFLPCYLFLWNSDFKAPALRYFRELAESDPTPSVFNNVAWLLASSLWSPAPPSEAVGLARRALDALPAASPLRPTILDTLSVALANAGGFPAAAAAVSEAIDLLPPSSPSLPAMRRRLSLYRQNLPYREILGNPLPPSQYAYEPPL